MLPGLRINRRVNGRGTGGRAQGRDRAPAYVGGRGHRNNQSLPLRQVASPPSSPPSSPPTPTQQLQVPQHGNVNVRRHRDDVIWDSIPILTAADVLYVGLTYVNFSKKRQAGVNEKENIERFREHYGVPPAAVVPLFNDLKEKYPTIRYKSALMTLYWFKVYGTERQISGVWGYGDLKHIRETTKDYARKIASLEKDKIVFGGFDEMEFFVLGTDGVHFLTQEFRLEPSTKWFDFKSQSSGLKYLFAMAIERPAIVYRSKPFPASAHDITIFRGGTTDEDEEEWDKDSLYFLMEKELGDGQKGVGDSGFAGEPDKIITTKDHHSKELKEFIARVKNRQESLHIRLKAFNLLGNRFRHGKSTEDKMELHGICTAAITVIVQYDFETGRPPFQVR